MRLQIIAFASIVAAIGCGGGEDEWAAKRPATVPAQGTLTYKGEGVEGATVILAPANPTGTETYGASAMTGSGGSFDLAAFPPEAGVVPGNYKVGVTKLETSSAAPATDAHSDTALPPPKNLLPEQYADPVKSGITVDIPAEGKTDLKIELK